METKTNTTAVPEVATETGSCLGSASVEGQSTEERTGLDSGAAEELLKAGEEALTRLRDERSRLTAEEQLRRIGELDREVPSLVDLMKMPEYDRYYALVKKGLNLVDAYKLVHYDQLVKKAADAAARQAMRSIGSRQHMTAMAGQPGVGDYSAVPAEIAAEYRLAKPGISDREIRRRYRQYKKYKRQ